MLPAPPPRRNAQPAVRIGVPFSIPFFLVSLPGRHDAFAVAFGVRRLNQREAMNSPAARAAPSAAP